MPSIQEIEQFKQVLNELGSEREILAERSEQIEDIPPPEEGLSDDLRELLQGFGTEDAAGEGDGPVAGPSEEPALDPWPAPERGGRAGEGAEPEAALPDLDFASLFGEPPAEGAAPEAPATRGRSEAEEEGEAEGPSEAEEELPDEFDLLKLTDADFGELAGAESPESGGGTGEGDAPAVDGLAAAPEAAGGGDDGPPGLDIPGLENLDEDAVGADADGEEASGEDGGGGEGPEAGGFGAEGPDAFALEETLAGESLPEAEAGGEAAAPGPFGTEEPLPPLEDFDGRDHGGPRVLPKCRRRGREGPRAPSARTPSARWREEAIGGTPAAGPGGRRPFRRGRSRRPLLRRRGGSGAGGEPAEDDGARRTAPTRTAATSTRWTTSACRAGRRWPGRRNRRGDDGRRRRRACSPACRGRMPGRRRRRPQSGS